MKQIKMTIKVVITSLKVKLTLNQPIQQIAV